MFELSISLLVYVVQLASWLRMCTAWGHVHSRPKVFVVKS